MRWGLCFSTHSHDTASKGIHVGSLRLPWCPTLQVHRTNSAYGGLFFQHIRTAHLVKGPCRQPAASMVSYTVLSYTTILLHKYCTGRGLWLFQTRSLHTSCKGPVSAACCFHGLLHCNVHHTLPSPINGGACPYQSLYCVLDSFVTHSPTPFAQQVPREPRIGRVCSDLTCAFGVFEPHPVHCAGTQGTATRAQLCCQVNAWIMLLCHQQSRQKCTHQPS